MQKNKEAVIHFTKIARDRFQIYDFRDKSNKITNTRDLASYLANLRGGQTLDNSFYSKLISMPNFSTIAISKDALNITKKASATKLEPWKLEKTADGEVFVSAIEDEEDKEDLKKCASSNLKHKYVISITAKNEDQKIRTYASIKKSACIPEMCIEINPVSDCVNFDYESEKTPYDVIDEIVGILANVGLVIDPKQIECCHDFCDCGMDQVGPVVPCENNEFILDCYDQKPIVGQSVESLQSYAEAHNRKHFKIYAYDRVVFDSDATIKVKAEDNNKSLFTLYLYSDTDNFVESRDFHTFKEASDSFLQIQKEMADRKTDPVLINYMKIKETTDNGEKVLKSWEGADPGNLISSEAETEAVVETETKTETEPSNPAPLPTSEAKEEVEEKVETPEGQKLEEKVEETVKASAKEILNKKAEDDHSNTPEAINTINTNIDLVNKTLQPFNEQGNQVEDQYKKGLITREEFAARIMEIKQKAEDALKNIHFASKKVHINKKAELPFEIMDAGHNSFNALRNNARFVGDSVWTGFDAPEDLMRIVAFKWINEDTCLIIFEDKTEYGPFAEENEEIYNNGEPDAAAFDTCEILPNDHTYDEYFKGFTKHSSLNKESLLITTEDFSDYKPWSGAVDTYNTIRDAGKLDALESYLEELYPEGIDMTQINDILWFDGDQVLEALGISDEEDIEDEAKDNSADIEKKATTVLVLNDDQKQHLLKTLYADGATEYLNTYLDKEWKITDDKTLDALPDDGKIYPYTLLIDNKFVDVLGQSVIDNLKGLPEKTAASANTHPAIEEVKNLLATEFDGNLEVTGPVYGKNEYYIKLPENYLDEDVLEKRLTQIEKKYSDFEYEGVDFDDKVWFAIKDDNIEKKSEINADPKVVIDKLEKGDLLPGTAERKEGLEKVVNDKEYKEDVKELKDKGAITEKEIKEVKKEDINKESKVVKQDGKYQAQSEKGKNFGTYDTKQEAEDRVKQMEMFKHMKKNADSENADEYTEVVKEVTGAADVKPTLDTYGLKTYEAESEEWAVTDNYKEVEAAVKEDIKNLLDDLGVDALMWDNMGGIENYLDPKWFEEARQESNKSYAEDILSSEPKRFIEEAKELKLDTDYAGYELNDPEGDHSAAISDFAEAMKEQQEENPIEWYINNIGKDSIKDLVKAGYISFDIDAIVEKIMELDGPGHVISVYDGKMVEKDHNGKTYYLFRMASKNSKLNKKAGEQKEYHTEIYTKLDPDNNAEGFDAERHDHEYFKTLEEAKAWGAEHTKDGKHYYEILLDDKVVYSSEKEDITKEADKVLIDKNTNQPIKPGESTEGKELKEVEVEKSTTTASNAVYNLFMKSAKINVNAQELRLLTAAYNSNLFKKVAYFGPTAFSFADNDATFIVENGTATCHKTADLTEVEIDKAIKEDPKPATKNEAEDFIKELNKELEVK